jgi:predicted nucleic acid-binding protein
VTLIDSNVLIDVVSNDPIWSSWSLDRIDEAVDRGPIVINDVIYAEVSTRFALAAELDAVLATLGVVVAAIPRAALFAAGKAFVRYRQAGGERGGVLPDFFIGAHAVVEDLPLLTRDTRRFRSYFPTLRLISPERE